MTDLNGNLVTSSSDPKVGGELYWTNITKVQNGVVLVDSFGGKVWRASWTVEAYNAKPTGNFSVINSTDTLSGTASDPTSPNTPIQVRFYNGPVADNKLIGSVTTAANGAFQYPLPTQYRNNVDYNIYTYGVDLQDGSLTPLNPAYLVFNSNAKPRGSMSVNNSTRELFGDVSDPDHLNTPIGIHFYKDGAGVGPFVGAVTTQTNGSYRFSIPSEYHTGTNHIIYGYAIDFTDQAFNNSLNPGFVTFNSSTPENGPDLTAGAVTHAPQTTIPNSDVVFTTTITNLGNQTATFFLNQFQIANQHNPGPSIIPTGLSTDALLDTVWSLNGGASIQKTKTYKFQTPGNYAVRACADSNGSGGNIQETNENNNCGPWTNITVTGTATCSNGATNPSACDTCVEDSVMVNGTCTQVVVAVTTNQTSVTGGPGGSIPFTYISSTNSGAGTECRLLDNATPRNALTQYAQGNSIDHAFPNSIGTFGYYIQCRDMFTITTTANSALITVTTVCPTGTDFVAGQCRTKPRITVTQSANGSITPTGETLVVYGSTRTFTVNPNPGYNITIGGTCPIGSLQGTMYTTGVITSSCTVVATFTQGVCEAPLTQNVTVACDPNSNGVPPTSGNVTRSQTKSAYPTCTFATPVTSTNSTYVSDTCVYPPTTYTVTPNIGQNGSVSPNTPQSVESGSTKAFTINPSPGYLIDSTTGCNGTLEENVYTTGPVNANCTVSITFKTSACTGGATNPPACTTCPTGSTMVNNMCTPVTVTATANPTTYTTTPNTTVAFAYTASTNSNAGTECRLLGNTQTPLTTTYRQTSPITHTVPNGIDTYGYYIQCRDRVTTSAVATSALITVTTVCPLGTDFVQEQCRTRPKITASQSTGGTVSPSGETTVVYGSNKTYYIEPTPGYNTLSLIVNGVTLPPSTSHTFTNVTTNKTISARYESASQRFNTFFQVRNSAGVITDLSGASIDMLSPGSSRTMNQNYTFGSAGTYAVRACADKSSSNDTGLITESDENNNCGDWVSVVVRTGGTCPNGSNPPCVMGKGGGTDGSGGGSSGSSILCPDGISMQPCPGNGQRQLRVVDTAGILVRTLGSTDQPDGDVECGGGGTKCHYNYSTGVGVKIRAYERSTYWRFSGWESNVPGLCSEPVPVCSLNLTQNTLITPKFVPRGFQYEEF